MNPDYGGGYDVRGWGYIYGGDFLLSMRERGFVRRRRSRHRARRGDPASTSTGSPRSRFLKIGGWNYARRGPLAAPSGTSPFMTPPGVQVLVEAERQGFPVKAEGHPGSGHEAALELTIGEDGVVAYSAQRKTRESPGHDSRRDGPDARGRDRAASDDRASMNATTRSAPPSPPSCTHWDELLKRKQKNGTHVAPYGVAPYYFFYAHGYAAEAIERLPEAERAAWRDRLNRLLMSVRDEDGSWNDRVFPRSAAYGTAVTVLAFTEPGHAARTLNQPPPPQAPEPTVGEEAVSDDS